MRFGFVENSKSFVELLANGSQSNFSVSRSSLLFLYLPACNEDYLPLDPRILFSKRLPFYQRENPDIYPWLLEIRLQPFHIYHF
ncbi:hypothetical protein LEP1GSC116_0029 [Leptospira interrogans serovar Icterohaemorrhagiae str. Verdun HP]|uniref:Uncharacterized protein n=1 Tax=Leptospira interrogans serovar Icterohaemorrhagiae str. Verdun HP TaxID=1049910 RepID=M6RJY1_LEPIR|nr:hypothetical protein LEP1GSC116_0029 [Leptospira interrogans serovar Icterohaemorrhagiae str. Verdun HP]